MIPDPLAALTRHALHLVLDKEQPDWDEKLGELETRIRILSEQACDQSDRQSESKKQHRATLEALESKNTSLESSLSVAMTLMVDAQHALKREITKRRKLSQELDRIEQRVAHALKG